MKTIATINFKGGVGETTTTWALGHVAAQSPATSSLVFDLDAQMSLTQSIALNEDGSAFKNFTEWYDRSVAKNKTIFSALDEFTKTHSQFNFGINFDFIYRISDRYHFVPSIEDLYWTELEILDRDKVKFFIQRLLEKVLNSKNVPNYDFVLFDCPPSFRPSQLLSSLMLRPSAHSDQSGFLCCEGPESLAEHFANEDRAVSRPKNRGIHE
jgi:chromosome partitioning protein